MKKTPKSIHISAIVLNSILLLVSIFLFIRLVSDVHNSSSLDEKYVIQFVTHYIWLVTIIFLLRIATLVIDILGAVSAFNGKNTVIGILYILGIFITSIISIVAGGLALRNLNKNKTNNGNDQTLNNIHLQAPEL
ncbi:hypothetical protein [Mycoplasmopsis arginini]|uniref:hypothetical protein n=2 Tax=Mycoplasmopsis TaxID=2767358 RepID=UPI0002D1766E|nr:hypothetical protein [Mycoplasmopsis arginini]ENY69694.1 Hypothetical protein, predicted transmembrane protein [Mycoplasmopsis arginini 7264]